MKTLLVVDDEVLLAEGLRRVLSRAFSGRLDVLCCYSAESAMKITENTRIDILLTDINMPGCSGLSLHEQLVARQGSCQVIYLTGYSEFEYARRALDQQAFAYVLKGEGDAKVIETIERALAARELPPEKAEADEVAGDWLESLQSYIQTHLSEDLSLNQLAEHCHFHPVYLSRVFKEATGETLSNYINQVKQQRAEELLRVSDLSVLEISRITGFATDNYFCRWFRKRTGATPQAYRAKCRKKH